MAEIDRGWPAAAGLRGECRPALDVIETAKTLEVIVDLPGVSLDAVRIAFRNGALVIVGAKAPVVSSGPTKVHVAERSYGRFARVVRLSAAVDASHAKAVLKAGQLRVVLPRVHDRRGHIYVVQVEAAS